MAELQRNFLQGIMNKDLDPHFLPDGQYRDALNIIVSDSDGTFSTFDGEHNGVVQNYLGNIQMNESIELGNSAICIGAISNQEANTIYWFVTSDNYDAIYEYNEQFDTTSVVLKSIKSENNVLNFNANYRITGVNYINGLLFWTDNYNPPRKINIERCKNYAEDEFTEDDINVIVKPPIASPSIELSNDIATTANNLENKFLYFSYRYKYLDDEYSSLSPFSPVAFLPKPFAYDYGVSENVSMVNSINTATILYNTGGPNVKEIQLVFIDTLSTNAYVIDNINKEANNFADDAVETFDFKNNKVYTVLPSDQINRLFDNVPLKAQAQDLIGSRLIYGNYTQFFNLVDSSGANIKPAFSLSLEGDVITDNLPHATFKSNRDYELGIVYLDDYGRSTTVIVPTENTNTLYIPADRANYANDIMVTIDKDYAPPAFATYYRFVLKQDRQEYYNVFPLTYYSDGQFKWFLINQSDVDKISVGSYLYLKNSTNTNLNTQFKVLDVVSKSANFLNNAKQQPAGVYFKVKIEDNLLPALYYYKFTNIGKANFNVLQDRFSVAETAIFYGLGDSSKMTTSNSNIYSGINDVRFKVEISSTNKFKYYAFSDGIPYTYVNEVTITPTVDQTLSYTYGGNTYSCTIKFTSITGLILKDYWIINCRSLGGKNIFGGRTDYQAFSYNTPFGWVTGNAWNLNGAWSGDRAIEAGATISIKMKEPNNGNQDSIQTFVASKTYVNIEEWFIGDNIYLNWAQYNGALSIGAQNVCFRRIIDLQYLTLDNAYQGDQGTSISNTTLSAPVFMWIFGYATGSNPTMEVTFDLQQSLSPMLFETVPTDTNQDIYYELTNTYPIVNGSHTTNFTNQVLGSTNGYAYLNRSDSFLYPNYDFNAFAWSNGVESFRIRDDWNAATMQFSPRANSTIEGYAQQTLVQALTYSGVYQQTTAINRLNEFNLSLGNFKYLDRFFGSVEKLHARDTDLVVFQENKVSKVLYGKNLISDSVGGGTIASIPEVLGTQISYVGEYGISNNPESFAIWGNNLYFTDARRGAVLQLTESGLFEISSNGMKNWFKNNLNPSTIKIGMMDPYFEHYVLSADNDRPVNPCQLSVSSDDVVVSNIANINQFAFAIESNTQWAISVPSNNWLTVNNKYGNGNGQVLVTTTETEEARSVTVTVTGCDTSIDVIIRQSAAPPIIPTTWYSLKKCSDDTNHFSQGYESPTIFFPNERVTSGGSTYVVLQGYSEDPGGTQLPITATGFDYCPSVPPTQEWYSLVNCTTSATANSIGYSIGTYAVNARVTSGGNTYRVASILTTSPGGTQLTLASTGLTGCPTPPVQVWYRLYNCGNGENAFSIAYNSGTYNIGRRVISSSITYTITEVLTTQPIGTLLTLTDTGETGCPTTFTYYTLVGTTTSATKWYKLYNCTTGAFAYSIGYPDTIVYTVNDRVTSGGVVYTIADSYTTDPGGTQISITATGLTGCPTVAQEWYYLTNCSTGATANSIAYPPGTFPVNRQVTSGGNTYVITSVLVSTPIGSLLTLTDAGTTGCPAVYPTTWYTLRKCSDNSNHWSEGYTAPVYFAPNERVTSGGSTYVVLQGYSEDPGAVTQLPITATGQFYCPSTPPTQEWYYLINCTTSAGANSVAYNIGTFNTGDRVINSDQTYRIAGVITTNPGGTQISIASTGFTGCPASPPTTQWYSLINCATSTSATSIDYGVGTFDVNEQVTSGGVTYRISGILSSDPGGPQLSITATGSTGCPSIVNEWYQLYICTTGVTEFSNAYAPGSFSLDERVLTEIGDTAVVSQILTSEPYHPMVSIATTGQFGCS